MPGPVGPRSGGTRPQCWSSLPLSTAQSWYCEVLPSLGECSHSGPANGLHRRSEAIRKLFCTAATRSSSILAVMKLGATAGSESIEHKMYMTDLDHSSTGCYTALIVLAVPTVPAMPGVRPLNHPAFFQRREAFR